MLSFIVIFFQITNASKVAVNQANSVRKEYLTSQPFYFLTVLRFITSLLKLILFNFKINFVKKLFTKFSEFFNFARQCSTVEDIKGLIVLI